MSEKVLRARVAELERERVILMDANEALIEANGKLSVGYLAHRINRTDDKMAAIEKKLGDWLAKIESRVNTAGKKFKDLDNRLDKLEDAGK